VLQRIQSQIGKIRGFRVTENAKDTTLVVKMIVKNVDRAAQFASKKNWRTPGMS
jgi:hypothetical protein